MTLSILQEGQGVARRAGISDYGVACTVSDLNPIEHLWGYLKRRLAEYEHHPKEWRSCGEGLRKNGTRYQLKYVRID